MTVSPGNAGASIAPTSIAMRTTASNTRSTASDATAATNPTRGVSRVSANARATSPARAGRTLLTIMPTAVARQSSMNGNRGATGSRITRQRIARNGKIDVATAAASTNSPRFACARPERTSAKGMSLKVHQSSPALNAKPSAARQPIRIEFNPFPRGREDPFPRGPHLAASSPRADVPTRWRIVHACGPVERKSATGSPRQQADEPDEGRWQDIADHTGELHVGVFEYLLDAQDVLGDLPYELLARAGEVAQLRRAASDSLCGCARLLAARARGAAGHAPGDLADAWPRSWSPRSLRTGAPSRAPATWRAGPRCARAITRARPSPDPDSM